MNQMRKISGGVCAPHGFSAGAVASGIKSGFPTREDLAVIVSHEAKTVGAGTFTTNQVKAAPVRISAENVHRGRVRAVVLNSGNANACTGEQGLQDARAMTRATGALLEIDESEVLVCSTGRIGVPLPIDRMTAAIPQIVVSRSGSAAVARAIMTSDTFAKQIAFTIQTGEGTFRIGGLAKGAGMIDPNMATMLAVITTDAKIPAGPLRAALRASVEDSFNRITVDGDMSTNDTVILLANGASGVSPEPTVFRMALDAVTRALARMIVEDGEGVSRFVEVEVRRAATKADARRAAEAVANSVLVKCAWAGGDPNWGRIIDAVGYSGVKMKEDIVDIFYDEYPIVAGGLAASTPEKKLKAVAARKAFRVTIDLQIGNASHVVWTTDLTEEYVRLNLGE